MQGGAHLPASALEGGGFDAARDCGEGEEEEDWVGGSDWNTQALVQGAQTSVVSMACKTRHQHVLVLLLVSILSSPVPTVLRVQLTVR